MIIKAYLSSTKMEDALGALQTLPSDIKPVRFSVEEGDETANGRVDDKPKFKAFIAKNEYGFFLFAERARYNVFLRSKGGFSSIVVDDDLGGRLTESDAVVILNALASAGSDFSFAASSDEYHHRNRYFRKLGANQFEAWIGRDLRKYLPGIYWLTALSKEHYDALSEMGGVPTTTVTQLDPEHWLIKAFDNPASWQQHADRLDNWLATQPGFFSKRRIQAQLDAVSDMAALSELVGEWR